MKIKLNKYINIVRPAPRGRRADPEGVRDPWGTEPRRSILYYIILYWDQVGEQPAWRPI